MDWEDVKDFFEKIWAQISPWFLKFFKTTTANLAESLKDIATVVVEQLEAGNLTSSEKQAAAFEAIVAAATSEGIEFTEKSVNLAIEMAVAILSDATTTDTSTSTTTESTDSTESSTTTESSTATASE
jgi:hypothetical protein